MNNNPAIEVKVEITATVRVLSTIQGRLLSNAEVFKITSTVLKSISVNSHYMKEVCDTLLRTAYVKHFRERLRKDPILKGKVGGTKWSVDPMLLNYEIV